jgi:hypothetical protein
MNFQEEYAKNLTGISRGTAIYKPLSLRETRVGDVAFFDPTTGDYTWIANAFRTQVGSPALFYCEIVVLTNRNYEVEIGLSLCCQKVSL